MKVKALFNRKRKKQIKEALKRGDANIFKRGRAATRARDYSEWLLDLRLIGAAREGDLKGVKDAIRKGADVHTPQSVMRNPRPNLEDCQEYIEMTPLEAAEEGGNPEIIELLIRRGATK